MVAVLLTYIVTLLPPKPPQAGNIYIADYEVLDGIKANDTDPCTLQYVAAPICLLYKNIQKKIVPIAIQVA